ncbi:hypothetical protein [Streptomyces sp. SJL17-1]|uniref:hypothetical protein n=1 Tax=Streptomyces sp. SJL17-1 TaxID=2967223 RepID=UPI002967260E|nr:hypothetical protein [Streptomyces sp. SJL17-1]
MRERDVRRHGLVLTRHRRLTVFRSNGEDVLGDGAGIGLADGSAGYSDLTSVQAHEIGDRAIAADRDSERGERTGSVGMRLVQDRPRLPHLVVAAAERLSQEGVALPKVTWFHARVNDLRRRGHLPRHRIPETAYIPHLHSIH